MRRLVALGAIGALAAVLVASAGGAATTRRGTVVRFGAPTPRCGIYRPGRRLGAPPRRAVQCVLAPWLLIEAGPGGRSIVVQHGPSDACFAGPGRAVVTDTARVIRVQVWAWAGEGGRDMGCSQRLVVRLPSPIGGRRLLGEAPEMTEGPRPASIDDLLKWVPDPPYSDVGIPLVPRVLHLARRDASRALRDDGFHMVVMGRGPEVVRQTPGRGLVAPGSTPRRPFGGVVRIVLGR